MNTIRKVLAMVLTVILVVSLATTAFAAEGDIYEIYQIFTGDISDGKLVNVKWGQNGTGEVGKAVDTTVLDELTTVKSGTDAEKLAVIEQYANLTGTPHTTGSVTSYTLPNGYYLVKNVDDSQEDKGDFYTLHIVQVVDGTLTFSPKGDAPEVEKDVNDTDLNIGDTVTFTLTATMPSTFEGYERYKVIFHDTMSEGLTFDASSVKVSVGGNEVDSGFQVVNPAEDGHTFDVVIADVKTIGATVKSEIKVEYTATLNSEAVVGTAGNPNSVTLEYSNDPNWDGEGTEPTGVTPPSEEKVYTWDMEVLKYADGDENDVLEGVQFILLNKDLNKIAKVADGKIISWDSYTAGMDVTAYKLTTDKNGKISIGGLESGNYYLRETDPLPGYNNLPGDVTVTVDNNDDNTYTTYLAKVNNQSGATLPTTGGMGTTMFYIIGGVLVAAAVILLVTKKRMASAE